MALKQPITCYIFDINTNKKTRNQNDFIQIIKEDCLQTELLPYIGLPPLHFPNLGWGSRSITPEKFLEYHMRFGAF